MTDGNVAVDKEVGVL